MTAFLPINSHRAAEFVEKAGIPEARRFIVDFAAAGLLKAYAETMETIDARYARTVVRGAAIPVELWKRIVAEGLADDVWFGGSVRLQGSGLIGGTPSVTLTGIGFSETFIQRIVDQHSGRPSNASGTKIGHTVTAVPAPAPQAPAQAHAPTPNEKRRPEPAAIPDGALLATIAQTQAALGFGRTKVNELMNTGRLTRREIDGGVRIEVASILTLAGSR